jgi:hypothetical protein
MELRDAMADAFAAARMTGGSFRQLAPVYADRMNLAYQVMRGRQVRRMGRALAVTAAIAAVGGAATALVSDRLIAARRTSEPAPEAAEAATPAPATDPATATH